MKALLNKISKAFYINLDRRQDRREHIDASLPFSAERFPAVDGKSLELSPLIKKLFPENFAGISKAEAACALSHYMLWKALRDDDAENYLILEDDAVFEKGFAEFWNEGFSLLLPEDYSLIYLGGCQPWNKPSYHKCLERYNDCFNRIKINDFFQKGNNYWHMNASSYIISKNGAIELCNIVDRYGFNLALDHFMIHTINSINNKSLFHLHPLMSYQLHEENNNPEIDKKSDIRLNKEIFLPETPTEYKKISVIIPTVWMANDYMLGSLYDLERNDSVREVIIVNNRVVDTPDWIGEFKKVKLLNQERGLYFNASVNLAVPLCQSDICCILNDDVKVDQGIFSFASESFEDHSGCLFISPDFVNSSLKDSPRLSLKTRKGDCHHAISGMLMFFKGENFVEIPKQMVHYFGDIFIWRVHEDTGLQNFLIEGFNMETPMSASRTESVDEVIKKDAVIFAEAFAFLDDYSVKENYTAKLIRNTDGLSKMNFIWQGMGGQKKCYEKDWLLEIFDGIEMNHIEDNNYGVAMDNSIVIYSDMFSSDINRYPPNMHDKWTRHKFSIEKYFNKFKSFKNCFLVHLSDEHTQAEIGHYKYFKHVFRNYYTEDASADNVTFFPLGYKKGFHHD